MNPIQNVGTTPAFPLPSLGKSSEAGGSGTSFKDFLIDSIREVNSMQKQADQAVESLATGGEVNAAEVMISVQKADIAFRMMTQIRNKIVQAYQEVQGIRV